MSTPSPIAIPALLNEIDLTVFTNTNGQITEPVMNELLKLITVSLRQYAQNLASLGVETRTLTATADGQTVFGYSAGLPPVAVPKLVIRFRVGMAALDPDTDYTVDNLARTLTLNVGDLPVQSGEKLMVLYQVGVAAMVGQALKLRLNAGNVEYSTDGELTWAVLAPWVVGNVPVRVDNVAALAAAPNDSYAYSEPGDDGSITEVRKIGGQLYESIQFIPYVANP